MGKRQFKGKARNPEIMLQGWPQERREEVDELNYCFCAPGFAIMQGYLGKPASSHQIVYRESLLI